MVAAIEKKDAAALRKIYADSFVHTHGSGKVDGKDARIVSALAGDPVIENAPVTDLVIRVPGGWTAIATGHEPDPLAGRRQDLQFPLDRRLRAHGRGLADRRQPGDASAAKRNRETRSCR